MSPPLPHRQTRVLVIHVFVGGVHRRGRDTTDPGECSIVRRGLPSSSRRPILKVVHFREEDRRVQRVQPTVRPNLIVVVLFRATMRTQ